MRRPPVLLRLGMVKRRPAVSLHPEGQRRPGRHVGMVQGNPRLVVSVRSKGKRRPAVRVRSTEGKRPQAVRVCPAEGKCPSAMRVLPGERKHPQQPPTMSMSVRLDRRRRHPVRSTYNVL